ncbi:MAG: UDP-N-acetylmuramoyl-tripeptide--D-alanyl-D-alanine ligase, partial [Actinobacteria bacterium]|nr:UDP-N-acetylmuramoyl-tripeptide--D-alanyl-D-alanine ligase [Actinomycetota bacterium]
LMPSAVRDYVKQTAEGMACDPALVAVPMLAGLAAAIGNTRTIMLNDDWVEPSILWVAVVADSGALGPRTSAGPRRITVHNTLTAFGSVATAVLAACPDVTVLALTGSSGKTSTKDILGQILRQYHPTVSPPGSFNNELGLPTTVCAVTRDTRFLVLEMGARGVGHIATLCRIARPDIAIALNVGSAHLGEFGSQENIAKAKGEIVEALAPSGIAILNADDPIVAGMAELTDGPVRWFGSGAGADVQVVDVELDETALVDLTLRIDQSTRRIALPLRGAHQGLNAAAAAAAATAAGLSAEQVFDGLEQVRQESRWRMDVTQTGDGTTVINDAYNANPESMSAGLRALAAMGRGRQTWAVLGEMRELGDGSMMAHDGVGRSAVRLGIDNLVGIGPACRPMVLGAASEGYYGSEAYYAPEVSDAAEYLSTRVGAGDVVLVKASRGVALEHLAAQLIEDHGGPVGSAQGAPQ